MKCPRCGSTHIGNREVGKRSGATVGGLVGASVGIITSLRGAQVGATIGAVGGPVGIAAGGLSGALLAGLFTGSAGCAIGSLAGNLADANFLTNRACLDCGHTFRAPSEPTAVNVQFATASQPQAPRGPGVQPAVPGQYFDED